MADTKRTEHYNNWPNSKGFTGGDEQKEQVELLVSGDIPSYAAGVLYRTGPGRDSGPTASGQRFQVPHWFDGFSQIHRFQIVAPQDLSSKTKVFYNSRFQDESRYQYALKNGHDPSFSFGPWEDPCEAIFKKTQSEWDPADPLMHNVAVTVSYNMPGAFKLFPQLADKYGSISQSKGLLVAKTDASVYKAVDPSTLEPLAVATQHDLHSNMAGELSASHARSDPKTGDIFNYNCSVGCEWSTYNVFTVSASTNETKILATFEDRTAYVHSLFLTQDYVILGVWNSHLGIATPGSSVVEAMKPFDSSIPSNWWVVDRTGERGVVAKYEGPAMFCFHSINAWQEPAEASTRFFNGDSDNEPDIDIVMDMLMYDNLEFVSRVYYKYMKSDSPAAADFAAKRGPSVAASTARFRLPNLKKAPTPFNGVSHPMKVVVDFKTIRHLGGELPTYNGLKSMTPTRYTYMVTDRDVSTFFDGIAKFDSVTHETKVWEVKGQTPGEAIFVPDPNGVNEDDGVLLSVVLDGYSGKSYLLCLDARTMTELGRAQANVAVSFGFHGQHIKVGGATTGDA